MSKWPFAFWICLFLFIPSVVAETIKVEGQTIAYDAVFPSENIMSYYRNGSLVLSTFDTNSDGLVDQWFVYGPDFAVLSSSLDSDFDGKSDYIVGYDDQGNVVSQKEKQSILSHIISFVVEYWQYLLGLSVLFVLVSFFLVVKKRRRHKRPLLAQEIHERQHTVEKKQSKPQHPVQQKKPRRYLFVLILLLVLLLMILFQQYVDSVKEKEFKSNAIIFPSLNTTMPGSRGYDPVNRHSVVPPSGAP